MALPQSRLPVTVEIAPGANPAGDPGSWSWVDVTSYVRYSRRLGRMIYIEQGRDDWAGSVTPSTCRLWLDNRDGNFSPRNPLGTWYGSLGRNTPIRVRVDVGSGPVDRFNGFVSAWPQRWDKSGNDATVPIEANGILRRLGQGQTLRSPIYRSITADAVQPIAYWPLEDEPGTTQAASGLVGGAPMPMAHANLFGVALDPVTFASHTSLAGALQTPDFSGPGRLVGRISGGSTTSWHWEFMLLSDYGVFAVGQYAGRILTSDATLNRYYVLLPADATDGFGIRTEDDSGSLPSVSVTSGAAVGSRFSTTAWHHYALTCEQSGGSVVARLYVNGALEVTHTVAGTLGAPRWMVLGGEAHIESFGHALVGNGLALSSMGSAAGGYVGEEAHTRISRLCSEEGIQYTSSATSSETMGVQDERPLLDLLEECAEADQGVLYESGFGLGYFPRVERYNRPVDLELDFDQGQVAEPPEPTDDDQTLRNRWTIRRRDGSWATAEDSDSIATVGLYDDEETVNVETDGVLLDHAAWRVHVGTTDVMRWPRIDLNLARAPEMIDQWLACGTQSRVTAVNPPAEVAGDDIDVIIEGYSETLGYKDWDVALNCTPAQPWTIATVSDPADPEDTARVGTNTSTLAAGISSSAMSLSVASSGSLWTTTATFPADFPLDINVSGERIRISGISGTSSPQTFTVAPGGRAINGVVKTHSSGASVKPWRTATVGL